MASTATNRREQLRRQQEAEARAKRVRRIVGWVAAAIALVLVGVFVWVAVNSTKPAPGGTAAQTVPTMAGADKDSLVVARGREGTPTVSLYLDYQCPNCKHFEEQFGSVLEDAAKAGDWTLEYKTMTFMDKNLQNTASSRAAVAAACAADPAFYSAYNKAVYANQAAQEVRGDVGYSDQLLRETLPTQVGMTGDKLASFQACYDGKATKDFVAAVDKSAYADGVTGTPTLLVNGKKVDFAKLTSGTPEAFKAFVLSYA